MKRRLKGMEGKEIEGKKGRVVAAVVVVAAGFRGPGFERVEIINSRYCESVANC